MEVHFLNLAFDRNLSHYRHIPLIKVGVSSTSSASNSQEYLQHVSMLPNGGLIIIKDNDIFFKPAIKADTVEQITKTGDPGKPRKFMEFQSYIYKLPWYIDLSIDIRNHLQWSKWLVVWRRNTGIWCGCLVLSQRRQDCILDI